MEAVLKEALDVVEGETCLECECFNECDDPTKLCHQKTKARICIYERVQEGG